MYDEYDFGYYEPSNADIFFDEMKEKFREYLTDDVKHELDRLREENEELKKENINLRGENNKLNCEKKSAAWSKESIRKEVENEFYNKNIDEVFKDRLENIDVWFADYIYHDQPKCKYCNNDRKRVYEYPDGFKLEVVCNCAKQIACYEPNTATFNTLTYCIKPSRYLSERKMYVKDWNLYRPNNTYRDYGYGDFKILHIIDVFDDNTINLRKALGYGEEIGFKTKEECQKYCDWLNRRMNKNSEDDEDEDELE